MSEPRSLFHQSLGVLVAEGDISSHFPAGIDEVLNAYLATGPHADYCIDLTCVNYCDMSSIVSIVRAMKKLTAQGKHLRLKVKMGSHVYRLLKRTQLLPLFDVEIVGDDPETLEIETEIHEELLK